MRVVILDKKACTVNDLPSKVNGQYNIIRNSNGTTEFITNATEKNGQWVISENNEIELFSQENITIKESPLIPNSIFRINLKATNEVMMLFVEADDHGIQDFIKYDISNSNIITIGSDADCDFVYNTNLPECEIRIRLEMIRQNNIILVQSLTNVFSYADEKYFKECEITYGSTIYILGLKIIVGKDFLMINNPNDQLRSNYPLWHWNPVIINENVEEASMDDMLFSCSPRTDKLDFIPKQIVIESPPSIYEPDQQPAILMVGPAMTMAGASVLTSMVSVTNIINNNGDMLTALPSMVMAGSMVLGSLVWPLLSRRNQDIQTKRKNLLAYQNYKEHLDRVKNRIQVEINDETKYLKAVNPTLEECRNLITTRSASLWKRSLYDDDFLNVLLGYGNRPLLGKIQFPNISELGQIDSCKKELALLQNEKWELSDVPYALSLKNHNITGIVGKRKDVLSLMQGMLIELAALHNYNELKMIIIADEEEHEWDCCKWLPHCWNNTRTMYYIARNTEETKAISQYLDYIISTRKELDDNNIEFASPYYLIIAASRKLAEKSSIIKDYYTMRRNIHIGMIALYNEEKYLPNTTTSVVTIKDTKELQVKNLKELSLSMDSLRDAISNSDSPEDLFIQLDNVKLDIVESGNNLPESISFFDMFQIAQPVQYDFIESWKQSNPVKSLATPIGIDENGYMIQLDIHEKAHGPHGLIAGTTGSGKSEFIISYIASLAMRFNPEEVSFILIDFKGGGMADVFMDLPHLAGSITNLDGNELNRSLFAIQSELEKRQTLFKETSEKLKISNIDIYKYQSLRREGRVKKALPHLIIISDEFAELKQQHSEFMEQLIRIARIGRSLGVHLILATQKPDGVVDDQIRSNVKFSICLKVQDQADSKSVIGVPDAASLINAGRFYLKVGMNEVFELGQSGWSGAPYIPQEYYKKTIDESLIIVDGQQQIKLNAAQKKKGTSNLGGDIPEKQIDAFVQEIARVAKENNYITPKLWLEKLKGVEMRSEEDITTDVEKYVINPIIGVYDDLYNQKHEILSMPFTYSGNAAIYGVSGSGTLEFVNQAVFSMIERYSAEELQIHICDFDSGSLMAFEAAPQVEEVYCAYEQEKIVRMIEELNLDLEFRKKAFAQYGGNYQTYIHSNNVENIPNRVLIIHNYPSFVDAIDDADYKIAKIVREGIKFGIFVMITLTDSNSIGYRYVPLYKQVFVLQQNNQDEYHMILGKRPDITPANSLGRGIFARGNKVYEFQTNMIFEDSDNLFEAISQYCRSLNPEISNSFEEKKGNSITIYDFLNENGTFTMDAFPVGVDVYSDEQKIFDFTGHAFWPVISDSSGFHQEWKWFNDILKYVDCEDITVYDLNDEVVGENINVRTTLEEIENDIIALNNEVKRRSGIAVSCMKEKKPIPDFPRKIIIAKSFSDYSRDLSLEVKKILKQLGMRVSPGYHLTFIIFDKENVSFDTIYKYCMSKAEPDGKTWAESIDAGLWLGTKLTYQTVFDLKNIPENVPHSKYHRGYIIDGGEPHLCKMVEINNS